MDRKNEKVFDEYECEDMIKDAIDNMNEHENVFCYSTMRPFKGRYKQMLRNSIYLRFNCQNKVCLKKGKKNRFTSTRGTVLISFQFQEMEITKTQKFKFLLVFKLKIFRMECLNCRAWGVPEIYDSELFKIEKQFCQILSEILNEIPPRPRRNQPKKIPELFDHKHLECEACQVGKCHVGPCESYL